MGAFSIPAVRSLIDTSPHVFYPAKRDRTSSDVDSFGRGRPSASLPASASALDLSGAWQPVSRRSSFGSARSGTNGDGSTPPTPDRSSHRRSQSAVPRTGPSPMGRLQEFSRNPLASISAISLPTLAELDAHHHDHAPDLSISPSPIIRPPVWQSSRVPVFPAERATAIVTASSSVPPPQKHASMPPPPPPKQVHRPPPAHRAWSSQDIPNTLANHYHPRRTSVGSTSSLSDVSVLATWSFPSSPEKARSHVGAGRSGERLRESLRNLSTLDASDLPDADPGLGPGTGQGPAARHAALPNLAHRHSHPSPTPSHLPLLQLPSTHPFLPPPRPQRRPTTSRLRQPNPLCMPIEASPSPGPGMIPASSPGSMVSDDWASVLCPSPTNSVESLPLAPAPVGEERRGWLGRLGSRKAEFSVGSGSGTVKGEARTLEAESVGGGGESVARFEEEDYIDFDEM